LVNVPEKFNREMWFNGKISDPACILCIRSYGYNGKRVVPSCPETRPAIVRIVFVTCPDMDDFLFLGQILWDKNTGQGI